MKRRAKTLGEFEETHGAPKMQRLQRELEIAKAKLDQTRAPRSPFRIATDGPWIRFGIVSDTHYGSLYHYYEGMAASYEFFQAEGIKTVLHPGDVIDGHRVYKGQEFELLRVGQDAQIAEMTLHAPKIEGLVTRFITGNHDASIKNLAGVCTGPAIQASRPDWVYEGEEQAMIRFVTPAGPYDVMMMHPGGGSSYAISYRAQKLVEQLEGGTKPNMLLLGHYHKASDLPMYRNISVIQCGTMQRQTPFMARNGLAAHVGCWIVEVKVGDRYNRIRTEFVAQY